MAGFVDAFHVFEDVVRKGVDDAHAEVVVVGVGVLLEWR